MRGHAERGFEQQPRIDVEHLEEAAVERDAGGVTLAPFDRELSAEDERRHVRGLRLVAVILCGGVYAVNAGGALRAYAGPAIPHRSARACQSVKRVFAPVARASARPAHAASRRDLPRASRDHPPRSASAAARSAYARMAAKRQASISCRSADSIRARRSSPIRAGFDRSGRASAGWRDWSC